MLLILFFHEKASNKLSAAVFKWTLATDYVFFYVNRTFSCSFLM